MVSFHVLHLKDKKLVGELILQIRSICFFDRVGFIFPSRIARLRDSLKMELILGIYTADPPRTLARPRVGSIPCCFANSLETPSGISSIRTSDLIRFSVIDISLKFHYNSLQFLGDFAERAKLLSCCFKRGFRSPSVSN